VAIFTAPFLVLFLVVYVAPIIYSVVQSLFIKQSDPLGLGEVTTHFAGLDNYREVLGDSEFWASMRRILAFGLVQVPVMVGIAVGLALLLDSAAARGVRIFRLIYFLPYAIPGVIAAVIWSYLYAPSLSPVAEILKALGLSVDFLGQSTVLWSMANVTTWCWTGYNMLIFLAALQAIPRDQYEAARIDGASEWRIAFRVKLPQIGPALVLSGTLSIIGTIQLFNEPKILSQVSTAVSSGYVPMMFAQHEAFMNNNINYAAAISVVIALIAGVLSLVFYRATNRRAQ
jgi:multiple sugar transport system permease protein